MAILLKATAHTRMFMMVESADHITALTGATVTVNISKNGGSFGAAGGSVTEVANGWYYVALNTTDTGTAGDLAYHCTAASGDATDFVDQVADPAVATLGANLVNIAGSAVSTSSAQLGVNAVNIGGQAAALDGNNLLEVDVVDWKGSAAAAMTGDAYARLGAPAGASVSADVAEVAADTDTLITGVNTTKFGGTSVTGRDLGASVLLSAGSGTGQLDFTSGVVKANLAQILGTALTETSGYLAAAFKAFFNIASPVFTTASVNQTGDSYARLGAPAGASVSADIAAVETNATGIKSQTDKLAFTVSNQVDSNVLDWKSSSAPAMTGDAYARLGAPAGASVSADVAAVETKLGSPAGASMSADIAAILTTAITESYAANGAAPTVAQALCMIQQMLGEFSISGTTLTVNKKDHSTAAATFTLNDGTSPTALTRAS